NAFICQSPARAPLRHCGRAGRICPRLPLWLTVWLVLGMGLFGNDSLRAIFKRLQPYRPAATPNSNTITHSRLALGLLVFRILARLVVNLLCQPDTPGAFYQGMRLMAIDGFVLDLADTPQNDRAFGRPKSGRSPGAFPQARVVALCEVGSHAFWRWTVKPCWRGEATMAHHLLGRLEPGMLVLLDRNLLSCRNLSQVLAREAHLLARVPRNRVLEPVQELADGSYLARTYRTEYDRKKGKNGTVVRVIEYTLCDPQRPSKEKVHRLVTTLTDAEAYPALDLVELYHQRWEEELSIDELKTHQKERPVLRSQTPRGVAQEIERLMLAHYCARAVMCEAAGERGVHPRRVESGGKMRGLRAGLGW